MKKSINLIGGLLGYACQHNWFKCVQILNMPKSFMTSHVLCRGDGLVHWSKSSKMWGMLGWNYENLMIIELFPDIKPIQLIKWPLTLAVSWEYLGDSDELREYYDITEINDIMRVNYWVMIARILSRQRDRWCHERGWITEWWLRLKRYILLWIFYPNQLLRVCYKTRDHGVTAVVTSCYVTSCWINVMSDVMNYDVRCRQHYSVNNIYIYCTPYNTF